MGRPAQSCAPAVDTQLAQRDLVLKLLDKLSEEDRSCQETVLPACQQAVMTCQQELGQLMHDQVVAPSKKPPASKKVVVDKHN